MADAVLWTHKLHAPPWSLTKQRNALERWSTNFVLHAHDQCASIPYHSNCSTPTLTLPWRCTRRPCRRPCPSCSGIGAAFNIVCLILSFIFPAKNRAPKTDSEVGFFRRFSSSLKGKGSQAAADRDTEAIGSDKTDLETATNIVADSSRL